LRKRAESKTDGLNARSRPEDFYKSNALKKKESLTKETGAKRSNEQSQKESTEGNGTDQR